MWFCLGTVGLEYLYLGFSVNSIGIPCLYLDSFLSRIDGNLYILRYAD